MEIKLTLNSGLLWNMIAYLFYAKYMEVLLFFLRSIKLNQSIKQNYFLLLCSVTCCTKNSSKHWRDHWFSQEVWEVLEVLEIRQIWEVQKFPEFKFLNLLDKKTRQNIDVMVVFLKRFGRFRMFWKSVIDWRFGTSRRLSS